MSILKAVAAAIWVIGLIVGYAEYQAVMEVAQSSIHEVYAVASAMLWIVGFYVFGRAVYVGLECAVMWAVDVPQQAIATSEE